MTVAQPPDLACPTGSPDLGTRLVGVVGRTMRIVAALFAGAVLGAGLTAGWMLAEGFVTNQAGLNAGATFAPVVFYIALPVWTIGLLTVGLPILGLLHVAGVRSRRVTAMVGALMVGLVEAVWLNLPASSGHEFTVLALFVAGQALAGAIVGLVVARIVYGRKASV